jgi:hypothetical protein
MKRPPKNITHSHKISNRGTLRSSYIEKILHKGDLAYSTVDEQVFLVEEMLRSELGTFILENKGANGFWTDVLIKTSADSYIKQGHKANFFEDFLLFRSPVVLAHRERFKLFQKSVQRILTPGISLASIPCGLMRDLLSLDFSSAPGCKLTGIDIDPKSIQLASNLALSLKCKNELYFLKKNAWNLKLANEFDIITSSGLNVYEPSRERTIKLYKLFLRALKKVGVLITSVLTFPPFSEIATDWDVSSIPSEDLRLERVIHHDILGVKWGNYRSIDDLKTDFYSAGFSSVEIALDSKKIFPTIIAKK